jgi:hypothetical protein
VRPFGEVALIDFSLNPRASRALFTDESLGGLANCLHRAKITPVPVCDSFAGHAELVFLIAPTRRLTSDQVDGLIAYMRSGGGLVLAKGHTSPEPCVELLSELGFEILPIPLGGGDATSPMRHKDALAILYSGPPDTATHVSAFSHPTIVTRPVGRGTFTLISDGRFLMDGNLESETGCVPENVEFLAALLDELRKDKRGLDPPDSVLAWNHSY